MRVVVDDEVIPADRLPQLIRATVSILWQLVAQLCDRTKSRRSAKP